MNDIKMTGIDPETFDRIKKNISRLLTSSLGDDNAKKGLTNVEIYNQIYGDRDDIQDPSKANKIAALRRGDGISLNDIIKIAAWKGLSLDWLILGKEPTAKPPTAGHNSIGIKAEESEESIESFSARIDAERMSHSRDYISRLRNGTGISLLSLTDHLQRDITKATIMQMSASLLYLFNYANVSIVDSYDENNFEIPQSLTIKITPKNCSVTGIPHLSGHNYKLDLDFTEEQENTADYTFWDIRATLIQRLLAIACKSVKSNTFDSFVILKSNLIEMSKRDIEISNGMHFLEAPTQETLFNPIFDNRFLNAFVNNDLYLNAWRYGYQDLMHYTSSCPSEKIPADLDSNDLF